MQEEVNEKTISLCIKGGKITAQILKAALIKLLAEMDKKKQQEKGKGQCKRTGKQSIKSLQKSGAQITNIVVTDNNIKSFDRVARKYGIDYSLKKVEQEGKTEYLVFFKAKDVDVMTAAFKEYTSETLKKQKRESVRQKLEKVKEELSNAICVETGGLMALFFYKEKNKDIRAAAYLRLSIEDGDKAESNSIGNQRELIRDFAAERPGLHLVEEYADDGYTGTNFERPGFKRMMEDIKSGKINCIIVKDLSRLGRNYIEMGKYLEQIFPMMGIRFIAINDNYDNANTESSDSDSIVVPFKNLLNDSYCRDISIKVRSQLDMKRCKGEFIGGYAIYGYCKDKRNKNRLVVDEYAADIVRSIYRRKLEGMSAQAISEQLNSENVLAPSEYKRLCGLNYHSGFKAGTHAKWQAIQVLRILKNEVYTGTMVQGRRQKINYKIKKIRDVEESGWIRVPNMHEAIIPQKLFDTVQEVLKLDTCASKGQRTVNLFSGIVRCGSCGQNMVRRTVSKNGKKYIYLHCVTNHNGLGCSSHLISESKLAEVVLAALQGKVQQISGLEHRLDEINEIPKNERRLKSVEEHLKMLEQEEQKYQTLRRQLYEDMSSGIVSKEEYKEFSHSFNEKVEAIRKAKAEMNRQRDCLNNLDVEHLPWIEDFKSYQNLTSLNRRVLVELVESITVYDKEHIHIQYRFDQEIRNVLEYCSSVPAAETEESAV